MWRAVRPKPHRRGHTGTAFNGLDDRDELHGWRSLVCSRIVKTIAAMTALAIDQRVLSFEGLVSHGLCLGAWPQSFLRARFANHPTHTVTHIRDRRA